MGFRAGLVVSITSFLLGTLFTHWIADSLTLWKSPVTDEHLWIAASYYRILAKGPWEAIYALGAVVLAGAGTILWSLRDGEAGNLMFDGASIFLYCTTVGMYMYSVIPHLWAQFTTVPPHRLTDPFPTSLRQPTLELASSNLVCSVTLTGVLALQAGRWWAERVDDAEEESVQSLVQEDDDVTKRRKEKAAEVKASGSGTRKLQKRQVQS